MSSKFELWSLNRNGEEELLLIRTDRKQVEKDMKLLQEFAEIGRKYWIVEVKTK